MAGNQPWHLTFAAGEALLRRLRNWPAGFYNLPLTSGRVGQVEVRASPLRPHCCVHTLLPGALDCLLLPLTLIFFFPSLFLNFLPAFHTKTQSDGGLSRPGPGWGHSRVTWGDASHGAIVVSPSSLFLLNSVTSQATVGVNPCTASSPLFLPKINHPVILVCA